MVGNEGIAGISLFMGGDTAPSRMVVRSEGQAYRLLSQQMKTEFNRNGAVRHVTLRYTLALITQMAQKAVCNRHHRLEQQLCRWLLSSIDRLPSDNLTVTHELIGDMLGVRREGVTEAAGKLQAAGLIRYRRGVVEVLYRGGLERAACECYDVVKKEYQRLLPRTVPDMHTPQHLPSCKFGFSTACMRTESCRKIADCTDSKRRPGAATHLA
jgi:hypothetical protein